ncbi:hypothetical protein ACOCEA_17215 [Maribacter sp. CXY002]|uniref:hypothetical protein n=1 Tax=Maribacter luteocoastalis TaxID=3407671 RepID=UPI003B67D193
MKKIMIMAALVLACGLAMAQRPEGKDHKRMQDMTPEQVATLHTKKMTLALDLTEAQQTKMKSLLASQAEKRKAKMEEFKAKKENGEQPTADEKFAMQNERLDAQIAHKAEMKKILNDEQYAKWEKMQHHRGKHGKGKMKERKSRRE